jgi:hypothetical protein
MLPDIRLPPQILSQQLLGHLLGQSVAEGSSLVSQRVYQDLLSEVFTIGLDLAFRVLIEGAVAA